MHGRLHLNHNNALTIRAVRFLLLYVPEVKVHFTVVLHVCWPISEDAILINSLALRPVTFSSCVDQLHFVHV